MRSLLAISCVLVLGGTSFAGDPPRLKCPPKINQDVIYVPAAPMVVQSSFSGVVPTGQHAHRKLDGTVFVHRNENMGNAAAHQGVAYPWIRTAEAGQYVGSPQPSYSPSPYTGQTYSLPSSSSNCPGGNCPVPSQTRGLIFRR